MRQGRAAQLLLAGSIIISAFGERMDQFVAALKKQRNAGVVPEGEG